MFESLKTAPGFSGDKYTIFFNKVIKDGQGGCPDTQLLYGNERNSNFYARKQRY